MKINFFLICILLICGIILLVVSDSGNQLHRQKNKDNFFSQNSCFALLGDSHFALFDYQKLLPQTNIINYSISSNTTGQMLSRLKSVIRSKAKYCLIMGGTNNCFQDIPINSTLTDLRMITKALQDHDIIVVIHTIPNLSVFVNQAETYNIWINQLNSQIRKLAQAENLQLIDLNINLCPEGVLPAYLTCDGIHLNRKGYMIWAMLINDYINSITTIR